MDTNRVAFENWSVPEWRKHPASLNFTHAFNKIICNLNVPSIREDD